MNNEVIDLIIAEKAKKEVKDLVKDLLEADKAFLTLAGDIDAFSKKGFKVKTPKEFVEHTKKATQETQKLNEAQLQSERTTKSLNRVIAKKNQLHTDNARALQKQKLETAALTKQAKLEEQAQNKLLGAYTNLNAKLALMRKEYKDLAAKKAQGIALTKKEEQAYKRLGPAINKADGALKRIDRSVGQSFRNVGNYRSAIAGLGMSFRSLLSAFGLTSGVFLFANAVRDAIGRVRDFDKSMQNLAGVFRTTRQDLKPLEETIISVAGSTIRTSNEVAKLAETLATLGKSPQQIQRLLKPVIDLSLGLDAAADEAGEFLVQMLNAFGAADSEAAQYADTIATIRTSTTLDFQKMRDSFQYIAPISRILGKDLAYTGSVVGILADNSLKAEQAGRLLSTAQIKLATQGKTLDDALQQINKRYEQGADALEILTLSEELFGKQASKVGAILAVNTEAIELNAQAIRENGGALKDLTDRQLESLDAKLAIVDSAYEKFILSLDNGNSALGKFTKNALDNAARSFELLSISTQENLSILDRWRLNVNYLSTAMSYFNPYMEDGIGLYHDFAEEQLRLAKGVGEATKKIEEENQAFIDLNNSLAPLTQAQQDLIDKQKEINLLFGSPLLEGGDEEVRTLNVINDELKEQKDLLNDTDVTNKLLIKSIKAKIEVLEAEKNAILGVSKAQKDKNKALKDSITYFENQISKLKDLRDETALTSDEYEDFTRKIEALEFQVSLLDGSYDDLLDSLSQPLPDISFEEAFSADKPESMFLPYIDLDEQELFENAVKVIDTQRELDAQLLESKKEFYNNLKDLAFTAIDSIFEAESQRYDDRIDKNNEFYDNLLTNQELTEKQRSALEAEREKKNRELEKRKRETERKAFLFGQAKALADIIIETTKPVAAIKLQASVLAANPVTAALAPVALAQIPFAIGSGAAAAAAVVATTIPQFREGHLEGTHEGIAMINDAPGTKFREIVERKDGSLQMYGGRNQLIGMEKGDKVHKAGTFTPNDIIRQSIAMTVIDQQQRLNQAQQEQILNVTISDQVSKMFSREFSKLAPHKPKDINYSKLAQAINLENRVRNR